MRVLRQGHGIRPVYARVDTCAAEFVAHTPYLYSTYETESESQAASIYATAQGAAVQADSTATEALRRHDAIASEAVRLEELSEASLEDLHGRVHRGHNCPAHSTGRQSRCKCLGLFNFTMHHIRFGPGHHRRLQKSQ